MTPAIRRVAASRRRAVEAERELRRTISAAFADRSDGHTVEDIARAAELTKQRVYQIVREVSADDG